MRKKNRLCSVFLPLAGLAVFVGTLAVGPSGARLTIDQPALPLQLGSVCQSSGVQIMLRVTNIGSGASPALAEGISVVGGRYSGRGALPSIGRGTTANVVIQLNVASGAPAAVGNVSLHATIGLAAVGGNTPPQADIPAVQTGGPCTRPPKTHPVAVTVSATPTPITHAMPGNASFKGNIPMTELVRPALNAHAATSVSECGSHAGFAGGLVCEALFPQGVLILVWDYDAKASIDGFRVYRAGGNKKLVRTQANGPTATLADIARPSGGYRNDCYVVTAYHGSSESAPTQPYCVRQGVVSQTRAFHPANVRSWVGIHAGNTGILMGLLQAGLLEMVPLTSRVNSQSLNVPVVGFLHSTSKSDFGDSFYNLSSRAGIYFDLSALSGHRIYAAKLNLKVSRTMSGSKYSDTEPNSCAQNIGIGKDYWWTYGGALQNVDLAAGISPGIVTGPDVSLSVTKIVSNWVAGAPRNYGFILQNSDENLNAFTENSCLTRYFNESLEVTYF
ncbi:MAG: hypothetical protein M3Y21_01180 [Candidatus Eremiobacteraeota bacterium]|nr:hypothetical protein [Candidatus Eremiobacteraeota bacterium]